MPDAQLHGSRHTKTSKCRRLRTGGLTFATCLALADQVFAQAADPWTQAVQALQTAFTGPIATGLALVAIVVGGLMFAFGEGGAKRTLAGVVFGVGMAVGAVNFMSWLFP
ncbi:MAG TPA: TrbC/VirB2 family protein [Terriglobales bacterium]|jgi:type IV secretory pathway VirB2 component (pilin)|nr:TrbC/VirB2 family protein [Terriglobales bacterium]